MFNIRKYLSISQPGGAINHDNTANPIPDDLLDRVDADINELISYIVGAKRQPPRTAEEFKQVLTDFIESMDLDEFYPPGDPYVKELAERAEALVGDPNVTLNTPEEVSDLTTLALYDTVIYCDDSASMHIDSRIQSLKDFVGRVAKITAMLDPNGIKVRFINSAENDACNNIRTAVEVEEIISKVEFEGYTQIGTMLQEKILEPLLFKNTRKKSLKKPLLISTITDGEPNLEAPEHFKQVILDCKSTLKKHGYRSTSVMFQVGQVGGAKEAELFIKGLHQDKQLARMLYCTSERLDQAVNSLQENDRNLEAWLLDLLLKGIRCPKP